MSYGILCRQKDCRFYAAFRYTWPGQTESFCCHVHEVKLSAVAHACGFFLDVIALTDLDHRGVTGLPAQELPNIRFEKLEKK
jgi:hypothetical protein